LTDRLLVSAPVDMPRRLALQRSVAMRAALAAFVLVATAAVYTSAAPRWGALDAACLAAAAFALLMLGGAAHERRQPASLKIGPDGLTAWTRAGDILVRGRIVGCSQWTNLLLVLAVAGDKGYPKPLLITADALGADSFRQLTVQGRRGAA
jgi:hypothetical protein